MQYIIVTEVDAVTKIPWVWRAFGTSVLLGLLAPTQKVLTSVRPSTTAPVTMTLIHPLLGCWRC